MCCRSRGRARGRQADPGGSRFRPGGGRAEGSADSRRSRKVHLALQELLRIDPDPQPGDVQRPERPVVDVLIDLEIVEGQLASHQAQPGSARVEIRTGQEIRGVLPDQPRRPFYYRSGRCTRPRVRPPGSTGTIRMSRTALSPRAGRYASPWASLRGDDGRCPRGFRPPFPDRRSLPIRSERRREASKRSAMAKALAGLRKRAGNRPARRMGSPTVESRQRVVQGSYARSRQASTTTG